MDIIEAFGEFIVNLFRIAFVAAIVGGVMYAIGKGLQRIALRHRVKEAVSLAPNYHRPPTLAELARRAERREAEERTARIARNVMAQVSKPRDETEYLH